MRSRRDTYTLYVLKVVAGLFVLFATPFDAFLASADSGTLAVSPDTVAPSTPLTLTWSLPAAAVSATDWVGLYRQGAPDTPFDFTLSWTWATGSPTGSRTLAGPATPGTYEVRYFSKSSFVRLLTSNSVTVTSAN